MRRRTLLIGFLAILAFTSQVEAKERKVLFIGIDGCRFDAIEAANTPNLDQIREAGCYDPDCQILGERYQKNDTISGPGWSSILTGVWADKHGVHNNTFLGKKYKQYPHFFTRLKEVRPDAVTVSAVTWPPIQDFIVSAADHGLKFIPPKGDYVPADAETAQSVARILREENPTAVFYYIGQVDETGHKEGFHPTVQPYVAAIEQADKHIGEVLEALRSRKTYDDEEWLIIVTSDHGGKGTSHSAGHDVPEIRNSFLIVSGPAAKSGRIEEETFLVDAPVTALKYLGVDAKPEWNLDGHPVGLK